MYECVFNMAMALSRTRQVRDATYLDKTFPQSSSFSSSILVFLMSPPAATYSL